MSPKTESVKLIRSPIDTNCGACQIDIPFGAWTYYNPETTEAICPSCGAKRGWSSKQRIKQIVKKLELTEEIRALKVAKKIMLRNLMQLRRRVQIHKLGENDLKLEQGIIKMMDKVRDYLKHVGTEKEKETLTGLYDVIHENQRLQKEVRQHMFDRMNLIKKQEEAEKKEEAKIMRELKDAE